MSETKSIRVIILREGDAWVAQCLEHDIGAQAADPTTMMERLAAALEAECQESTERNGSPFAGIDPAPAYFFSLWGEKALKFKPDIEIGISVAGCVVPGLALDYALAA